MIFSLRTLALATFLSFSASAATISYKMDRNVGTYNIRGTLTTDGTTGILAAGNFTAWDLRIFQGNTQVGHLANTLAPLILVSGLALSATPEHLVFNFSALTTNYFLLQETSGFQYWCVETNGCTTGSAPRETYGVGAAIAAVQPQTGSVILASTNVPEPSMFAVMGGALAFLYLRRRK